MDNKKIGIGITTYNRPGCLEECKAQIAKHTNMDNVLIYVAEDTDQDRRGVAFRKNECLRALKDCDYVFLFDDDCFPIKDGWVDFFIDSKHKHLLYLTNYHIKEQQFVFGSPSSYIESWSYRDCGGVFMFMTKDCIQAVGALNQKFATYGFEHAEYSTRVWRNRMSNAPYVCVTGTDQYLFAHDYSTPGHKSSITDTEKREHVRNNWDKFFKEPIKDIYLPL